MTEISKRDADSRVAQMTAPKITKDDIEAAIASTEFIERPPMTICIATMKNGFTIVGKSGAASPENYMAEVCRRYALEDCIKQAWPLMGYALRERLWFEELARKTFVEKADGTSP